MPLGESFLTGAFLACLASSRGENNFEFPLPYQKVGKWREKERGKERERERGSHIASWSEREELDNECFVAIFMVFSHNIYCIWSMEQRPLLYY